MVDTNSFYHLLTLLQEGLNIAHFLRKDPDRRISSQNAYLEKQSISSSFGLQSVMTLPQTSLQHFFC